MLTLTTHMKCTRQAEKMSGLWGTSNWVAAVWEGCWYCLRWSGCGMFAEYLCEGAIQDMDKEEEKKNFQFRAINLSNLLKHNYHPHSYCVSILEHYKYSNTSLNSDNSPKHCICVQACVNKPAWRLLIKDIWTNITGMNSSYWSC